MLLHAIESGAASTATRTAVLLHGLMGSAESWWRVVPLLVGCGYRVLAIDLPGHGLSPRDAHLSVASAAASVVETVRSLGTVGVLHAMGHSYGGTVLAAATAQLRPDLCTYVDTSLALTGGRDRRRLTAQYERDREARSSPARLRARRPHYSWRDAEIEALAARRFDPATSASISCGPDQSWTPDAGSIVIRPEPSRWVSAADVERFEAGGAIVRSIPGAEHTVWYSHFAEFTASVPEMFGSASGG